MGDAGAGLVHGGEDTGPPCDVLRQPLVPVLWTYGEPSEHDARDQYLPQCDRYSVLHGTLLVLRVELFELCHRRTAGPLQVIYPLI